MVEVSADRKAVVFSYDTEVVQGDTVSVRAENTATGEVGERTENNDGFVILAYPSDFTGEDNVTVTGSDGGEDTGTVTIA